MRGYLEKGIQTLMAQGWSTQIISMLEWIGISRLSMKNCFSGKGSLSDDRTCVEAAGQNPLHRVHGYRGTSLIRNSPLP